MTDEKKGRRKEKMNHRSFMRSCLNSLLVRALCLTLPALASSQTISNTATLQFSDTAGHTYSGASNTVATSVTTTPPIFASASPSTVNMGGSNFSLSILGSGFDASCQVFWNGSARATTFIDGTHLSAAILSADIGVAGQFPVTGLCVGGLSNAVIITVKKAKIRFLQTEVPLSGVLSLGMSDTGGALPSGTQVKISVSLNSPVPGGIAAAPAFAGGPNTSVVSYAGSSAMSPKALGLSPGQYVMDAYAVFPDGSESDSVSATITVTADSLAGARTYPNPWRTTLHTGHPVTFDHLTTNSTVKIFTVSGGWVRTLSAPDGSVAWDLTNDDGNNVASGLYLYLITDGSGNNGRGKLGVVR